MPATHVGCQAGPNATAVEQLNGLASLHTRIRLGQASLADELRLRADTLQLPPGAQVDAQHTRQSLASRTAAVPWTHDFIGTWAGLHIAGRDADGVLWTRQQLAASCVLQCCAGHSSHGGSCASFSLQQLENSGDHLFVARAFSTRRREWKPEFLLHRGPSGEDDSVGTSAKLSANSDPLLAAALGNMGGLETLLVFDVKSASGGGGCVIPVGGAISFRWAPSSHAVLVLKHGGLARLNLHPYPPDATPTQLASWVTALPPSLPHRPRMVLVPGVGAVRRTLWVAHTACRSVAPTGIVFSLAAYSLTDLRLLGHQELHFVGYASKQLGSLDASRTALAFGFKRCTWVYRLAGLHVGPLLFRADGLCRAHLNPDGRFMAGICVTGSRPTVKVLDARDGRCLATVSHRDLCVQTESALTILGAVWGHGGQLLVRSALEDEEDGPHTHCRGHAQRTSLLMETRAVAECGCLRACITAAAACNARCPIKAHSLTASSVAASWVQRAPCIHPLPHFAEHCKHAPQKAAGQAAWCLRCQPQKIWSYIKEGERPAGQCTACCGVSHGYRAWMLASRARGESAAACCCRPAALPASLADVLLALPPAHAPVLSSSSAAVSAVQQL